MSDDLNKIALMSGKLNGTKTLKSTLEQIENPDEIEMFLKQFVSLKIDFDANNDIIYINDDQNFLDYINNIENSEYISIFPDESFKRLYITSADKKTYIVRINKVGIVNISRLISGERPIKFSLNSFNFIKWCVSKKIDMRNVYDIPTYIKILTNEIDPFKTVSEYVKEYSNFELKENDNEENTLIIGNFIYEFGKFLCENAKKFKIDAICKLINENSYYEATMNEDAGNCVIRFTYLNLKQAIESSVKDKENDFQNKAYVISPLGRIALKFGHKVNELLEELYFEDISITILNELYNNNIHVKLNDVNEYVVMCKYKNINNVFSLITAILNDVFYTMFKQTFEADIHCEVKE